MSEEKKDAKIVQMPMKDNKPNGGPQNGFRQEAKLSLREQVQAIGKMVQNLQMAVRMGQMMQQQAFQGFQKMDQDIGNAMGVINDLQYRTLAIVEAVGVSKDELDKIAERMKLKDYNDASDKEDEIKKYKKVDVAATEDHVVIISSVCKTNKDRSIFRSKFPIKSTNDPNIIEKLVGAKMGDEIEIKVGADEHIVKIEGIREVPLPAPELKKEEIKEEVKEVEQTECCCEDDPENCQCGCKDEEEK